MNRHRKEALETIVRAFTHYAGTQGVPLTEENIDLVTALTFNETDMILDYLDSEFGLGDDLVCGTGYCEWEEEELGEFQTSCGHTWYNEYPDGLTFCPYCGKEILD